MFWAVIAVAGAIGIAWEDFKYRSVHLTWYALLFIGLTGRAWGLNGFSRLLNDSLYNIAFVFLLLLFLTLYFSMKKRTWVWLFDAYIGWGDVLFFLVTTVCFSLEGYILFTIGSIIVALAITPLFFKLQGRDKHIPLAGIQACCLIGYVIGSA